MTKWMINDKMDECCAHASEYCHRLWKIKCKGGQLKDKSRGPCCMVAAFCCANIGLWTGSMKLITPGMNRDAWWDGEQTQEQAKAHLLEFDIMFPDKDALDIYDNSSGHNCMAKDALSVSKLNIGIGGKNAVNIRNGYYLQDGNEVQQSMFFKVGDFLHNKVKRSTECYNHVAKVVIRTTADHAIGEVIAQESELVGVVKGIVQVLEERRVQFNRNAGCVQEKHINDIRKARKAAVKAWEEDKNSRDKRIALLTFDLPQEVVAVARMIPCNCPRCALMKQDDFKNQKSGLEEIYISHNTMYNKNHQLKFLPKFHPELNMIERVWSRMKWYLRKHADGTLEKLKELMKKGLSEENLPLSLIRKYCRLLTAYYIAYIEGKDIIEADAWIRKHRSHRGHSELMDKRLEQLYFLMVEKKKI